MEWDGVLLFIAIITGLVTWLRWNYSHWKNKGIPSVEPSIIFGNFREMMIGNVNRSVLLKRFYDMFPKEPVVGVYLLRYPLLIVKDLDLIKSIMVTNFSNFKDNSFDMDKKVDPIIGSSPFFIKGDAWKEARRIHTHHHAVNKLKTLFVYAEEEKDDLIEYINQNLQKKYNAQDFSKRFTTDVVGSYVFGVKIRSITGEDCDFRKHSANLLNMNWKFILFSLSPRLFRLLGRPLVPKDSVDFFQSVVEKVVETRKKNNLSRADFLQDLITENTEDFSVTEMGAQAMAVFIDAYLTSSTGMCFVLYMLALHPDAQQRLRDEINEAKELNFDTIHTLPYLDAVFKETLRLYPPGSVLNRICDEDITLTVQNKEIHFKSGDQIDIPIYAIHRDPEIFPDPLKFDPDRFLEQPNHPAFLAFGAGPRSCFGQRFAKTHVKTGVAHLVKNFRIAAGENPSMPTVENNKTFLISPDSDTTIVFSRL